MDMSIPHGEYSFGLDVEKVVAQLRDLANEVEVANIIVRAWQVSRSSRLDDYEDHAITVNFVMKINKEEKS